MAQLLFLLCKIQFLAVFAVLHNGLLLMLSFSRTNLGNWSFRHQLHCSMLLLWIIFYIFFQIRNVTCNYVRLNENRPITVKKLTKNGSLGSNIMQNVTIMSPTNSCSTTTMSNACIFLLFSKYFLSYGILECKRIHITLGFTNQIKCLEN